MGPWGQPDRWPLTFQELFDWERWLVTREVTCPGCGAGPREVCDGWEELVGGHHSVRFLTARAKYRLLRIQEQEAEMLALICIGCGKQFGTAERLERHEEECL